MIYWEPSRGNEQGTQHEAAQSSVFVEVPDSNNVCVVEITLSCVGLDRVLWSPPRAVEISLNVLALLLISRLSALDQVLQQNYAVGRNAVGLRMGEELDSGLESEGS